jgi:hypothetical protein
MVFGRGLFRVGKGSEVSNARRSVNYRKCKGLIRPKRLANVEKMGLELTKILLTARKP